MGFWNATHDANLDAEKNNFNARRGAYDLSSEQYGRAGVGTHLKRSLQFMLPKKAGGAGRAGENLSNIGGRLTTHQLKTAPLQNRFMNQFLGSGFMYYGLLHGDSAQDIAGYTMPFAAASLVYSPVREVGMAAGKLLGLGTRGFGGGLGKLLGRGGGGIAALAAGGTAYAVSQAFDSNNFLKNAAAKIDRGSYISSSGQNDNTMTHRQKMLNKLSRSGLNDRGALLGNESMILRRYLIMTELNTTQLIGQFDGNTGTDIKTFAEIPWREYLESKSYNHDINEMCRLCIQEQKAKHGGITIACKGLASKSQYIKPEDEHNFTEEDMDLMEQAANPYHWAEKNIDVEKIDDPKRLFIPRWYQAQISQCTSSRKVIRCGRRAGKSYSLALNILHKVLTNKNYWVLIVTPYEVQSEEIINLILQFLFNINPEFGTYDDLVDSYKQSPNRTINFANGSRIKAFTTGSAGAASIRGQRADLIVIDEIDYITAKDFNSIIAILADKPHTELWTASTPDGEKQLYKLSKNKRYKEFHFPSFVLPHYNDELDSEFREATDETGFVQEIIAEFGTSKHGVFQKYYVDACTSLQYNVTADMILSQRNEWLVTMGCDWNHDKIGTRIVVLAFNKRDRVFVIAEKATVSKEGWTQTTAMQKIIDLNRKWNFEHLYVDRGYGSTQIEILTKYGFDNFGILPVGHPDLKLSELRGIDFNSNVEIPDPYTGNPIKKHMKPFMVNNLNKIIEKKMIKFDIKIDAKLIEQLKGYEEKRGVTGRPTYKASSETVGDHDLDALMLAALAFNLEYSDLLNQGTLQIVTIQRPDHTVPLESFTDIASGRVKSLRPKSRDILFNRLQGIYNTESKTDDSLSRKTGMRARLKQGIYRRARF